MPQPLSSNEGNLVYSSTVRIQSPYAMPEVRLSIERDRTPEQERRCPGTTRNRCSEIAGPGENARGRSFRRASYAPGTAGLKRQERKGNATRVTLEQCRECFSLDLGSGAKISRSFLPRIDLAETEVRPIGKTVKKIDDPTRLTEVEVSHWPHFFRKLINSRRPAAG